jgi:predicted RNase H-like HicB family nuclease
MFREDTSMQRSSQSGIKPGMPRRKAPYAVNSKHVTFNIETELETDGRWIAEILDMPGVLAYGKTEQAARANAYALALRIIADRAEKSKKFPSAIEVVTTA